VVAIAILGLVGAVALPAFREGKSDDVTRAAEQVMALLERARLQALERGTLVRVALDLHTGDYSMRASGGSTASPTSLGRLEIASGVTLARRGGNHADHQVVALFDHAGRARCDVITLEEFALQAEVSCDPWTGSVGARR
jgi:Tfp pilus assembly protein FimT